MRTDSRLRDLLSKGYFPDELPPPFHTEDFAKYRRSIRADWPSNADPKRTICEPFSIPRYNGLRRHLSIPNPVSQYFLSDLIAKKWREIQTHINGSSISIDKPRIDGLGARAIRRPDFSAVHAAKGYIGAQYDHVLISDFSRFYGTIYTHTIPWALHGKTWCKQNLRSSGFLSSLGNKLDILVRKCQDNQSIGIPIGPDTSRIISEIVAVSVDSEIGIRMNLDSSRALRFVDDFFIGFDSIGDAENAIFQISAA